MIEILDVSAALLLSAVCVVSSILMLEASDADCATPIPAVSVIAREPVSVLFIITKTCAVSVIEIPNVSPPGMLGAATADSVIAIPLVSLAATATGANERFSVIEIELVSDAVIALNAVVVSLILIEDVSLALSVLVVATASVIVIDAVSAADFCVVPKT